MKDITSKESYRRQFEAIQHCFRIIGFTNKVYAGRGETNTMQMSVDGWERRHVCSNLLDTYQMHVPCEIMHVYSTCGIKIQNFIIPREPVWSVDPLVHPTMTKSESELEQGAPNEHKL